VFKPRGSGEGWLGRNGTAQLPEEGEIVYVLAADNIGQYEIPFPVVFRDDSWWNLRTGEELDAFIAGWRPSDNVE
jgi:hypothetical protein